MTNGIIANLDVLEEDCTPQSLPCREAQKKELAFCLSPLQRRMKPLDCLCHGRPGTGKTALIKYVLQQLSKKTSTLTLCYLLGKQDFKLDFRSELKLLL